VFCFNFGVIFSAAETRAEETGEQRMRDLTKLYSLLNLSSGFVCQQQNPASVQRAFFAAFPKGLFTAA